MSAGVRVGVAGPSTSASASSSSSSPSIPPSARKVVQDLKEIVKNSEDEIYAMLKECNMDPNETVQRLLYQDTFHEVKRRRDRRKENANKEPVEPRARSSGVGAYGRGGRFTDRGSGRGNYGPRFNSDFNSSGRGHAFSARDNGPYQNARVPNPGANQIAQVESQGQNKIAPNGSGNNVVPSTGIPNGGSQYSRPRGNWVAGSNQATMAHIVRSTNNQAYGDNPDPASKGTVPLQVPDQMFKVDGISSSSTDYGPLSQSESHVDGTKQGFGLTGSEQLGGEKASGPHMEVNLVPDLSEQAPQSRQLSMFRPDVVSAVTEVKGSEGEISLTSVSASTAAADVSASSEGVVMSVSSGLKSPLTARQPNGRVTYQNQQHALGGSSMEWRPKSPLKNTDTHKSVSLVGEAGRPSPPVSPQHDSGLLSASTAKLQKLSILDDKPVIIPDHLQVSEADRTQLNFGSFGDDFDPVYSTNFVNEDDRKSSVSGEDNLPETESPSEQPEASGLVQVPDTSRSIGSSEVDLEQAYTSQSMPAADAIVANDEVTISLPAPVISPVVSRPEVLKSESVVQSNTQHPYLSAIHNYPGLGAMPQLVSGQYTYENPESQPQEVSRLPNFVSPYSDPGTNYYSPLLRPGSDVDARYSHLVNNTANKFNTGVTLMTGQGLSSSQEAGSSIVISGTTPSVQTSQTVGIAQTGLTIPQQPIPVHPYPAQHAGVPLTPFTTNIFGIQYVPSSYGYVPAPYQHSYVGNAGYPQGPGSSYSPAAAGAYSPAGATAIKYSLPQYKPGLGVAATGSAPHAAAVAAGYGGFGTSPAGFTAVNQAASTAPASSYDDVGGSQFKENNLFIPSQQQAEGSTVWIQPQLSRDMTGMQTNSYYNVLGQGQHTGFAHTQPMHAVPAAYASLYHQSQSGTAPAVHPLLQQPQALGAVGGVANQTGAYQQPQRGQLSWTNNY